jgi:dolichyl-phosphate-mannose--protein O-mannosyl transferase
MVGLFAVAIVGFCVIWDLWRKLDYRQGLTMVSATLWYILLYTYE